MNNTGWISKKPFADVKTITGLLGLLTLSVLCGVLVVFEPNSLLYLAGLIGVAGYSLITYSRPFAAFTILVFFALTILLSSIKVVENVSVLVVLGLIFSLTWASRLALQAASFVKVREYLLLIGLSATIVISKLYSLDKPLGFSSVPTYLQLYLLFMLVVNMATTPSRLRVLGNTIIISSTIQAIFILLARFSLLPPGLIVEQEEGVQIGGSLELASRTGGLWGDANFTAVQLTAALPFIVAEWVIASAWWKRAILVGVAGAILAAFSFTLSISGLAGLSAFLLIKALQNPRRHITRMFVRIVLITSSAILLLYLLLPDLFVQRTLIKLDIIITALDTQDPHLLLQSGSGRGDTWRAALISIAASPLLGHGPGNGSFENVRHSMLYGATPSLGAHNMFLTVGADLGLIGLALFITLLASAILSVRPLSDSRTYYQPLRKTGESIFIALVIYVVQGLALDIHNLKLLWVLLGMAIAHRKINALIGKSPR